MSRMTHLVRADKKTLPLATPISIIVRHHKMQADLVLKVLTVFIVEYKPLKFCL
jgi:hypothetical protein